MACTAAPAAGSGSGKDGKGGKREGGASAGPTDGPRWQPRPGTGWQWQLGGRLDTSVDVPVHGIDGFDHSGDAVAALHRDGRKVICCLSTGAWQDFRPDAGDFPDAVLGRGNGWKGERRLDIRRTDVLEPIMAERFDTCRDKGFDAVEPNNVGQRWPTPDNAGQHRAKSGNMDGYRDRTGFPLPPQTSSAATARSPGWPTSAAWPSA